MMVNVEEAQLIILLTQDEEERVAEFQKLAKVVPPNRVSNLNIESISIFQYFLMASSRDLTWLKSFSIN